ncbi:MAG: hypothetical protein U0931_15655 [Vulcanimicrobiota bacterium]
MNNQADSEKKRRPSYWLVSLGLICLAVLAFVITPNFLKARARGTHNICPSNCSNIASALDLYASEHKGRYPDHLADLTSGNYLRNIPTCPAAGRDTYSESYQVSHQPEAFTFACSGDNHAKRFASYGKAGHNYPRFNSRTGLTSIPE